MPYRHSRIARDVKPGELIEGEHQTRLRVLHTLPAREPNYIELHVEDCATRAMRTLVVKRTHVLPLVERRSR